jgi:bifunctional non-homologous end joining protein LigD
MNAATPRRRTLGVPLERPIEPADLMHATSRRYPFDDENWLYEIKFDGYRCLARKDAGEVRLLSREGNAFTPAFPEIANAVSGVRGDVVMDCELTVDDKRGHQLFEDLQRRSRMSVPHRVRAAATERPARLYVFDLLAFDSRDVRGLPLLERKRLLRDVVDDSSLLVFVNGILTLGCAVFDQVTALDLEGMVAKRLDSTYHRGRSRDWLKVKNPSYHRRAALGFGWHRNR